MLRLLNSLRRRHVEPITGNEARRLAFDAGFRGEFLDRIVAIAQAESGLRPDAVNETGNTPPTSRDRGILQINSYWHSEVTDECAFDPACAFREGFRISQHGTNFTPWAVYKGGQYTRFLPPMATPADWSPYQGGEGEPMTQEDVNRLSAEIDAVEARVSAREVNRHGAGETTRHYTVVAGDTAGEIAQRAGIGWDHFTALNPNGPRSGDWDLIYPGEVFRVA